MAKRRISTFPTVPVTVPDSRDNKRLSSASNSPMTSGVMSTRKTDRTCYELVSAPTCKVLDDNSYSSKKLYFNELCDVENDTNILWIEMVSKYQSLLNDPSSHPGIFLVAIFIIILLILWLQNGIDITTIITGNRSQSSTLISEQVMTPSVPIIALNDKRLLLFRGLRIPNRLSVPMTSSLTHVSTFASSTIHLYLIQSRDVVYGAKIAVGTAMVVLLEKMKIILDSMKTLIFAVNLPPMRDFAGGLALVAHKITNLLPILFGKRLNEPYFLDKTTTTTKTTTQYSLQKPTILTNNNKDSSSISTNNKPTEKKSVFFFGNSFNLKAPSKAMVMDSTKERMINENQQVRIRRCLNTKSLFITGVRMAM